MNANKTVIAMISANSEAPHTKSSGRFAKSLKLGKSSSTQHTASNVAHITINKTSNKNWAMS